MRYLANAGIWQTVLFANVAFASTQTTGLNGINSSGLGLTGAGIGIGQIEEGRPGKRIVDGGTDAADKGSQYIVPTAVFRRDGAANVMDTDDHAEEVAGVMISSDTTDGPDMDGDAPIGVAPQAKLYASAYNVAAGLGQDQVAISAQHVALQNGGDVHAINFSFGQQLVSTDQLDGNSLLTEFVDWSAKTHDTLYVIAGNETGSVGFPLPTDNYNGVTVAYTEKLSGVYSKLSSGNSYDEDAVGVRSSVDLLAPGDDVEVELLGGTHTQDSGTSIAAPHVTGTIALLQQFAANHPTDPHWNADARRHEVMKAVLLNSADKIKDDGSFAPIGTFIGMEKTIRDTDDSTWLDTAAYKDVGPGDTKGEVPLSLRLGAGQLNANRAKIQYSPGEYHANAASIPAIGWDFGTTAGDDSINKYVFASQIKGDRFVSLTLAWDRTVAFDNDAGTIGKYDIGDTFVADCCFTNLDLYLMPAGATDLSQAITSSQAADPNETVEHVFFKIPTDGLYEIWVHQFGSQFGNEQNYALAWWTSAVTSGASMGDYNGDHVVDAQDYNVWRGAFGSGNLAADGNGNGVIDAADYIVWRQHLGQSVGSSFASATGVPEPTTFASLTFLGIVATLLRPERK
jgi:hypothetical protein